MNAFEAVVDFVASPPWLFGLAAVLFLAARGSKWPWARGGGVLLLVLATAFLALGLSDEVFRANLLRPERLPVTVLLLSSAVLLWYEKARSRRGAFGEALPSRGVSPVDAVAATIVGLALVACAWLFPAASGPLADPASKPDLVRVPWFLLGLQEMAHFFEPWVAYFALPLFFLALLMALPWLGRDRTARDGGRSLFLFGWLLLWLLPLAVAAFLRGPHWIAFGPFETWDAARPPAAPPLTFSEIFWSRWLGGVQPERWWLRELPGMACLAGYLVLLPLALLRLPATRGAFDSYRRSLSPWRFRAALIAVLVLMLVPLKMAGRWLLDLGPWIYIPELPFAL